MDKWSDDELNIIKKIDELHLSTVREDGSLRNPVTIWVVAVADNVYIRSVKGPTGKWFIHAKDSGRAHIEIGDLSKNVRLLEPNPDQQQAVNEAYEDKYKSYSDDVVGSTQTLKAREATLLLVPDK